MKRLGIYLVYDRQKIVDRYIGYFLKELRTCVDTLVVVCNMAAIVSGEENITAYADQVFFRENRGFDAGGFKDALCSLLGWDTVRRYDELVLANDSLFGPFRPMKDIFSEMDGRPIDFWGLAKHGNLEREGYAFVPEHIQSYFMVIRKRMLYSAHFEAYWKAMPYYTSFSDAVNQYEVLYTAHFSQLGYQYDVFADCNANNSENFLNNFNHFEMLPYEFAKMRNFPFLKRKPLAHIHLEFQTQENLRLALTYVDQETDYPVELIWENIVRTFHIAELQRSLHLQYIVSPFPEGRMTGEVILVFVSYESSAEYILRYLTRLSKQQIIILASNSDLLRPYQMSGYQCREISPEKYIEFLTAFCGYEYVCLLQDADMTSDIWPSYVGKSYFYSIWENLARDDAHVSGIAKRFEQESRLGCLAPPRANFGRFFGGDGKNWGEIFGDVRRITDSLELNCQISEEVPPCCVTKSLWVRGRVLKRLQLLKWEDASFLPYLWSFLAQDAGYYSGIVESADYAAINEINLQYYVEEIADQIQRQCGDFTTFPEMQQWISRLAISDFCERYPKIFAYGTGYIAKRCQKLIPNVIAYLVSDGQEKPEQFYGAPVQYLSEVELSDDCGIVLCLNKTNQEQVIALLKERGFNNYFRV